MNVGSDTRNTIGKLAKPTTTPKLKHSPSNVGVKTEVKMDVEVSKPWKHWLLRHHWDQSE